MKRDILFGVGLVFWATFTIYLVLKVYTQFWEHELDTRVKPYIDERIKYNLCVRGLAWDCSNVTDEMRRQYMKKLKKEKE